VLLPVCSSGLLGTGISVRSYTAGTWIKRG